MWGSREKTSPKISPKISKQFSFKDIESLCSDSPIHKPDPFTNPNPLSSPYSSVFHRVRRATAVLRAFSPPPPPNNKKNEEPSAALSQPSILPNAENRIVVYLTSLHVIRSTFEACRTVRSILRGFRVTVDERDLAMDPTYSHELKRIFRKEMTKLPLPVVFIGGKYIGGAEELRQLNETGELKKMVERLAAAREAGVCGECGGCRFLVCQECNGSHKVYVEKMEGFRSCFYCNHNGLIRCSSCSPHFFL